MNRSIASLREWFFPGSIARDYIPPLSGGLRPNDRLDRSQALLPATGWEPDDVLVTGRGHAVFSSGTGVWVLDGEEPRLLARFDGQVGSVEPWANPGIDRVLVAVEGRGLVAVSLEGAVEDVCSDDAVRRCVTDLAVVGETVLVAVGSSVHAADDWARALVTGDVTGSLLTVTAGRANLAAEGLAWPSGVAAGGNSGDIVLALSHRHRIEQRSLDHLARPGSPILPNLPVYPGRLRPAASGWWVAAPYVRNRATELFLEEPRLAAEMVQTLEPNEWIVPQLRRDNPYRDPMQTGQLRVMGVLKPWAPPRSYGLAFLLGSQGQVIRSYHSRVDGSRHAVTGVSEAAGRVVLACRGGNNLIEIGGA
jgi:hypothetical protein